MVGFELENVMKGPTLYSCCMIDYHNLKERFLASFAQYDIFDPFANDFKRVLRGGNPRGLLLLCCLFCVISICFVGICPNMIRKKKTKR